MFRRDCYYTILLKRFFLSLIDSIVLFAFWTKGILDDLSISIDSKIVGFSYRNCLIAIVSSFPTSDTSSGDVTEFIFSLIFFFWSLSQLLSSSHSVSSSEGTINLTIDVNIMSKAISQGYLIFFQVFECTAYQPRGTFPNLQFTYLSS